jgi:hypothetical protein
MDGETSRVCVYQPCQRDADESTENAAETKAAEQRESSESASDVGFNVSELLP